ncbi:MAG: beta-ketoacyl-ACP synthase II [Candidatus Hydrogenedens sp.]|nr:beta-ketoacyl-ACP synthase II [Candidatus Hydrogenedens sp.]
MGKRVVITGMGVVSPLGNSLAEFWSGVAEARSGIRQIDRWDTEGFATRIAGLAPPVEPEGLSNKEMRRFSSYTIYALEASLQALKQAGFDINTEDPTRCGIVCGSGIGGIDVIYENSVTLAEKGPRRVNPLMVPTGISNMGAGFVAIQTGFMGPNSSIVTACATGAQSIGDAADKIRLGKADVMLAGGAEASVIPLGIAGFNAMRALSTDFQDEPTRASRPFDANRGGFVMGEGAGMLLLESEEHAKARGAEILAEYGGMGESCDAYHIAAPRDDGAGVAAAMRAALCDAGVNPEDVAYINAHGTSTKLNDATETMAIRSVFGDSVPPVSSTKSQIGHLLGAAGAVEAIACIQAIREGVLPPNLNYETPDSECDLPIVANESRPASVEIALSNSLGFGGHNAALVFRRYG